MRVPPVVLFVVVLVSSSLRASRSGASPSPPVDLDVAFVIDTTGSMAGEIREAKERVRQLAEALAAARPGGRVRLGVVAYRDRRDAYLTRVSPLAAEVETSFGFLAGLDAHGGGDGPEDVLAGLAAALHDLAWEEGPQSDRQVFLIGDAPPHLDYADGPRADDLLAEARARRIVVHAIGCRSLPPDGIAFFRAVAYGSEGSYQHIGRVSGAIPVAAGSASSATLAGAVLQAVGSPAGEGQPGELATLALADRSAPVPGEPLAVAVESGGGAGDGGCVLVLSLPEGVGLRREPAVTVAATEVRVRLALGSGQGERIVYRLAPCPAAAAPVTVDLED